MRPRRVRSLVRERPFAACGLTGFTVGSAISLVLAADPLGQLAVIAAGALAFLAVVYATEYVTGLPSLTFYHDALAVLAACAVVSAALGQSVLAHLDLTAVGLLVLLSFGRVGCLLVGCCHGRPASHGVVYAERRVALPTHLVGRALVPVPLYEAAAAIALAGVAAAITATGGRPGAAFAISFAGYGLIRIVLEEWRGDWRRPQLGFASEPQWTSALLVTAIAAGTWAAVLPPGLPAFGPLALAAVAAGIVGVRRRREASLMDATHVREVVRAARRGSASRRPSAWTTSRGIRVSAGMAAGRPHVSLSAAAGGADQRELVEAVAGLCLPPSATEVVPGAAGVIHVVASGEVAGGQDATPERLIPALVMRRSRDG
jgi:hypothetical protein